ncbi:MAG: DNA translocase FtsK [Treponema sp.]|jgi:S-DNA-T family DNA segregation ATPase FtsK/SpoIIIE|nr:DNA translocase FtsK [Treponema sp.]
MMDTDLKFRIAGIALAVLLGISALFLGFFVAEALLGFGIFPQAPGDFFVRSYGILAFLIPVFLGYAAFILADPKWRPDRIFILSAGIFPFLTLATGIAFIRDFEIRSKQFAFLDFAGKTGFSFVIVLITVLEVLALCSLRNALFFSGLYGTGADMRRGRGGRRGPLLVPPPLNGVVMIGEGPERIPEHRADAEDAEDAGAADEEAAEAEPAAETTEAETGNAAEGIAAGENGVDAHNGFLPDSAAQAEEAELVEEVEPLDTEAEEAAAPDDIERALKEAEAASLEHLERERRKKSAAPAAGSLRSWKIPLDILNKYPDGEYWLIDQATRDAALILRETLEEFKIQAEVTGIRKGPVITMFEILPAPGVKLSRIVNLQDNIALRLAASSVRIVAPIPGKHAVGIEVPNAKRNIVSFREIIEGEQQRQGKRLEVPVVLGKDITGEAVTVDLVQMPHLLIAGATGSGKSVCVNAMILSVLYQRHPMECRLMLIDPKIVELKLYNDIPHLLTPVITEPKKAFQALQYCIYEMERRYACLDAMGVRDIRSYNKRISEKNIAQEHMPYIVVVIDEFADLMATTGKELESTVARLCAMSRAVGIHLVLATQRPSIDVITGLIKANIPSRIAFMVASKMDSRIIIDMVGAEKLLGKGDMLYAGAVDPFPIRLQGAFVSEEEVESVVEYIKTLGKPDYIDDEIFYDEDEDELSPSLFSDGDDPLYDKALEIVLQQGKASASYIQRRLKIGYNRAARLVEEMEHKGVVGPAQGSKPRELLRGV